MLYNIDRKVKESQSQSRKRYIFFFEKVINSQVGGNPRPLGKKDKLRKYRYYSRKKYQN